MELDGRTAVITGAGSGIGRATARLFAVHGAEVAVLDRDSAAAAETVQLIRMDGGLGRGLEVVADVTHPDEMEVAIRRVLTEFGKIDILFNNAGISHVGMLHETAEDEWRRVIDVNVTGMYVGCRCVLPHMMERRYGCIINMSSAVANVGLARRAAYATSKGAVLALTRAMQVDYAPYGIRVNALLPGTIYTPFVEDYLRRHYPDPEAGMAELRRRQLSGELGRPEDVAYAALFLASDKARFVMGAGLVIDGGLSAGK